MFWSWRSSQLMRVTSAKCYKNNVGVNVLMAADFMRVKSAALLMCVMMRMRVNKVDHRSWLYRTECWRWATCQTWRSLFCPSTTRSKTAVAKAASWQVGTNFWSPGFDSYANATRQVILTYIHIYDRYCTNVSNPYCVESLLCRKLRGSSVMTWCFYLL